jgi:hypothetical protein
MSSSSLSSYEEELPYAGKWNALTVKNDGEKVVPEPHGDNEARKISKSQVMIPFYIADEVYALVVHSPMLLHLLVK